MFGLERLRRGFRQMKRRRNRIATLLDAQVGHALDAVSIISTAVHGTLSPDDCHARLREIEHAGDEARGDVVEELASAFILPLDREDLFRVSRSIDDVLDNLRDFARELALFDVREFHPLHGIVEEIEAALQQLHAALEQLSEENGSFPTAIRASKKASNGIRVSYDEAVGDLFAQEFDMEVLKQRELLRRLDVVGLRLGEAGDALADGAVKRAN